MHEILPPAAAARAAAARRVVRERIAAAVLNPMPMAEPRSIIVATR